MEYRPLTKIYYQNFEQYETIYQSRYNSEYTHHIDFQIGDYPAFFTVTPEIQNLVLSIYKRDKQISKICSILPPIALQQFSKRCLIDEIVLTNNIEGVHSTRREIDEILTDLETKSKKDRFHGLVIKYVMLQENADIPLNTCADLRHIYNDLVLDEVMSSDPKNAPDGLLFRKGPVSVVSPSQKEIHRGLYPEAKITEAMEKALAFLNDETIDILYRISLFHYLFGYIHPFYDGNGRTNRFISSYLLTKELESLLSFRLSYTIKQNISDYYESFKICNHPHSKGDLTPFLTFFLEIIKKSIDQLYNGLSERRSQLAHYRSSIRYLPHGDNPHYSHLYYYLVQAELFSEHGISTPELLSHMNLSRDTLRKLLKAIPEQLLKVSEIKHTKYYGINLPAYDAYLQSMNSSAETN